MLLWCDEVWYTFIMYLLFKKGRRNINKKLNIKYFYLKTQENAFLQWTFSWGMIPMTYSTFLCLMTSWIKINSMYIDIYYEFSVLHILSLVLQPWMSAYITDLVCYTYFHWFFNPECQHIFGKQTGYIFQSPKMIKTWTTKHYASLNQWYNTE